ncbi:MAG TPA: hypothetical protein DHW49_07205 [Anaerolineae bacterium]|nr:hypothetical protein [Anaerolineae bacterium]
MKKIYFLIIALVVLLSACSGSSVSLEGEWKLVSYGDSANPTSALQDIETSINYNQHHQINGDIGCNVFNGDYQIIDDLITFTSINSTKMYCKDTGYQETVVLNILSEQTLNFELSGNQLTLTTQDGSSVIVLERK